MHFGQSTDVRELSCIFLCRPEAMRPNLQKSVTSCPEFDCLGQKCWRDMQGRFFTGADNGLNSLCEAFRTRIGSFVQLE